MILAKRPRSDNLTLQYRNLDCRRYPLTFGNHRQRDIGQIPNCFAAGHLPTHVEVHVIASTHALHTERINLSPFTKDFRVWGAPNENHLISFRLPSGSFSTFRWTQWTERSSLAVCITHLMLDLAMALQPAWPWQQPQLLQKNLVTNNLFFFTISSCQTCNTAAAPPNKFELPQQEHTEIA